VRLAGATVCPVWGERLLLVSGDVWCWRRRKGKRAGTCWQLTLLSAPDFGRHVCAPSLLGASGVENQHQLDHNLNPTSPSSLLHLPSSLPVPAQRSQTVHAKNPPRGTPSARESSTHDALPRLRPRPCFLLSWGPPFPRRYDGDSRHPSHPPQDTRTHTHRRPVHHQRQAARSEHTARLACMAMRAASPPPVADTTLPSPCPRPRRESQPTHHSNSSDPAG
jgi:hypothetical protein